VQALSILLLYEFNLMLTLLTLNSSLFLGFSLLLGKFLLQLALFNFMLLLDLQLDLVADV